MYTEPHIISDNDFSAHVCAKEHIVLQYAPVPQFYMPLDFQVFCIETAIHTHALKAFGEIPLAPLLYKTHIEISFAAYCT